MEPLDLRVAPPRGPRELLAGIVFTARLVDKLRASLPGGELNGYLPTSGFSALWAYYTKIDIAALRDVVGAAADEAEVVRWIEERTQTIDKPTTNTKMACYDSSRTPDDMRPLFERFYPAELRERYPIVFDLLEADDARLFGRAS